MSYYEDLGVAPSASAEEIHDRYRTLVRLLHPDQHTDLVLKAAANQQLKRLNQIYSVLADSERRRRYNGELSAPIAPPARRPLLVRQEKTSWETFAWAGAVLLSIGLITWLAGHEVGVDSSGQAKGTKSLSKSVPPADNSAAETIASLKRQLSAAIGQRDDALRLLAQKDSAKASTKEIPVVAEKRPFAPPAPQEETVAVHKTVQSLAPPPVPAQAPPVAMLPVAALPEAVVAETRPRLAGLWVWAKPRAANKNKALYPPEFIEASIAEQNGSIQVRYRARYRISDRAISPDVNFEFTGKSSGNGAQLPWRGEAGAKGEVKIKLVSDTSLEVVWNATELGQKLGLASGTAILVRRAP